jgi:hypothetical protein
MKWLALAGSEVSTYLLGRPWAYGVSMFVGMAVVLWPLCLYLRISPIFYSYPVAMGFLYGLKAQLRLNYDKKMAQIREATTNHFEAR